MKAVKGFILIGSVSYLLSAVLLFAFQRELLYYPSESYQHDYAIESFSNEGEKIDVVILNQNKQKAILYFGGNGESVVHNSPKFQVLFPGHTVYLVNYRGYGGSTGEPTETGLYSDALHIFDKVQARHSHLTLIGRSLGTGIVTFLASSRDLDKLVLITPYDSIENVAQNKYPIYPISILLKDKFDSVSRAGKIVAETLVILAEHDQIIPKIHSDKLIAALSKKQLTVKTVLGKDHVDLSHSDEYNHFLSRFIN